MTGVFTVPAAAFVGVPGSVSVTGLASAAIPDPAVSQPLRGGSAGLRVDGLVGGRGVRRLFGPLRFRAPPGACVEVVGVNGSGKTTLLRILAGLRLPAAGEVCWDETPIDRLGPDYRAGIGWLGHRSGLAPQRRVVEELVFWQRLSGVDSAEDPAAVLERFGLGRVASVPCGRLSAGQARRLALALLWVSGKRLWLLDEPFAALDGAGCVLLRELVGAHLAAGGTVVASTHQPLDIDIHARVVVAPACAGETA